MADHRLDRYFAWLEGELGRRRAGNRRFYLEGLFDDIPLAGRSVLDVGAGAGELSLYAAACGARRVVALEPAAEGSSPGVRRRFAESARAVELTDDVELIPARLQDYDPGAERFDVILSHASINHLDEEACIRLLVDPAARATYAQMLSRLARMAAPGARLVLVDCDRRNLWAPLGRVNPAVREIKWHTHHDPATWVELLAAAGFHAPAVRWLSFSSLRRPGRVLLGNRFGAYLSHSAFRLTMRIDAGA